MKCHCWVLMVYIYIYICESTVGHSSAMFIARACIPFVCCSWLKALKGTISNAPIHGEKSHVNAASVGDIGKVTIISKGEYNQSKRASPIHRLSAVRSTLGVRWSHGNLQPLRHPGLPALLQVIDLGANGGRLTTRRCRRRTSRAATTQASPSERMLLRPRRSMTRLDPKRAAAARCPTVLLEV